MINIESKAWKILSPSGDGTKDYFLFMTRGGVKDGERTVNKSRDESFGRTS